MLGRISLCGVASNSQIGLLPAHGEVQHNTRGTLWPAKKDICATQAGHASRKCHVQIVTGLQHQLAFIICRVFLVCILIVNKHLDEES